MIYIFTLRYYLRPCGGLNEIYISSRISLPTCFYLNCCFCGGWCRHWHWSWWSWYAMALQISREIRVLENAMMFPVFCFPFQSFYGTNFYGLWCDMLVKLFLLHLIGQPAHLWKMAKGSWSLNETDHLTIRPQWKFLARKLLI